MDECGNDPIKLHLQKQRAEKQKTETQKAGWMWHAAANLPNP